MEDQQRDRKKRKRLLGYWEMKDEPEKDSHQDFRATIQSVDEFARTKGFEISYDERKVIDETGQLGGKTVYKTRDERVLIVERIPLCDACSNPAMQENYVCHNCGRKVCTYCSVYFKGVFLCKRCLMIQEPLDKREFRILFAVATEVNNTGRIAKAVRVSKEEVELTLRRLYGNGYIMLSCGILFKKFALSDIGEEVLEAYLKIYGADFDIMAFRNRLVE